MVYISKTNNIDLLYPYSNKQPNANEEGGVKRCCLKTKATTYFQN